MRSKTGIVVSTKNNKTIVVKVETSRPHPKYKKRYRVSQKFHTHDPENQYKEGQTVTIYECRPLSRLKRWTVEKPSISETPTEEKIRSKQ